MVEEGFKFKAANQRLTPPMPDIVVLIATRNRWPLLEACLKSLQAQELSSVSVVVRVVDNGSTDGSDARLRAYAATSRSLPVEILSHPIPGKSRALNAGLQDLHCEVVAFTDDDMRMDPRWLSAIWEHFQNCSCAGLAGRVVVDLPEPSPSWFTEQCAELLGSTARRRPSDPVLALAGGNMAVRASKIRLIGGFREDMGPLGNRFGSAEDVEWSHRMVDRGETLCYCPQALNYHNVGSHRVTRRALWMRQFEFVRRETLEGLSMSDRPRLWREMRSLAGALIRRKREFSGFDYGLELAQRCGRLAALLDRPGPGARLNAAPPSP